MLCIFGSVVLFVECSCQNSIFQEHFAISRKVIYSQKTPVGLAGLVETMASGK